MGIDRFFTKLFTAKRAGWSGESSVNVTVGTFYGHIQQLTADSAQNLGMALTKSLRIWCAVDTDIAEGDQLTYNSNTYSVRAINTRDYDDSSGNQHLEVFIEKDEE